MLLLLEQKPLWRVSEQSDR
ncbi:unnamed protein product [Notodromas monacha]|uniref:Uncharacterized protein n=1 Tax=Notodromas monacha TaxID=399045 RepID=A0A7R9C3I6_9CRUS|nr:unnamed protein product [Notodromas monacha]CAG0926274.1 unnamed protein product [Notodromas monacha]